MAITITKQIGTDLGITAEAYVRLVEYSFNKQGNASFRIQTFLNQEAAASTIMYGMPGTSGQEASVREIGTHFYVPMTKTVDMEVTRQEMSWEDITEDRETTVTAEDGTVSTVTTQVVIGRNPVTIDVQVTESRQVPDLSIMEEQTIFEFGYAKLKEKLTALYGAENIIDS
jgi:hypothetical protein